MEFSTILAVLALVSMSSAQSDGGFWWQNKNLMNSAAESRSIKEQSAKIRTLPPRYRKEDDSTTKAPVTTESNSIFGDDDLEEQKMFKYDDEPDCICTPKYLCNSHNQIVTDGNGVLDERAFSICGEGNVCCRVAKTSSEAPPAPITFRPPTHRPATTTHKSLLNFNLTNLLSTILKPVSSTKFDEKPTCVSRSAKKIEKRILIEEDYDDDSLVGETAFAEFPWMIEVLKKNRKTGSFEYKCGGVLISPTTAITANHCLKGAFANPSSFIIRAGEWDRSSTLEFAPHHDRQVSRIVSHPQYYSGGLFNDIALLKWHNPLEKEVNVAPLCLPEHHESVAPGTYCTVTGWGKANDDAPTTDKLKFAKVPIVSREVCERQFQDHRLGKRFRLHESFVCAGGEAGVDSCTNDGGSPLICPRSDGSFVLTGLVSWGLDCGLQNVPGAYTNVQHLLHWIKNHDNSLFK